MEKHGLGPDASMAVHINNICERDYVKIGGGRKLIPTNLGLSLINGYNDIDKDLSAPELRSSIERSVSSIAKVYYSLSNSIIFLYKREKKNMILSFLK